MAADDSLAAAPPGGLSRRQLEPLIFKMAPLRRYTQDSPILPDVWFAYGERPDRPLDLLLTPQRGVSPGAAWAALRQRLRVDREGDFWRARHGDGTQPSDLAYSQSAVVATLYFDEVVRVVLPLTPWHTEYRDIGELVGRLDRSDDKERLASEVHKLERGGSEFTNPAELLWLIRIVGAIELARRGKPTEADAKATGLADDPDEAPPLISLADATRLVEAVAALLRGASDEQVMEPLIYSVGRNRRSVPGLYRSVEAVKADAARRLFDIKCRDLAWAVVDSGIDACHPAFRAEDGALRPDEDFHDAGGARFFTRILATYDFRHVRQLLDPDRVARRDLPDELAARLDGPAAAELESRLLRGGPVDWDLVAPLLKIDHTDTAYQSPQNEHGTHVAGILAGNAAAAPGSGLNHDIVGLCPDLRLYDLRVLGDDGIGDEFSISAALQFVQHLNAHADALVIHGVNLSLSLPHDVANYACGRTPICEECERVTDGGVVVVAAAGNRGYVQDLPSMAASLEGYRSISITDPGNGQAVITVGSTHRYRPHTYGVSFFSSRGPTGDGRAKPDLVAPGEKIVSAVPGGRAKAFDGTSMAAPHVSGCAALLLARHRELVGQPERVKEILRSTATDLGRETYFQGAGMVDVLRAIQSV